MYFDIICNPEKCRVQEEFLYIRVVLCYLFMILFSTGSYAQGSASFGLGELINFQKGDFVAINDIVTKRGWEFRSSTKKNSDDPSVVTWAFGASLDAIPYERDEVKAYAWLFLYTYDNSVSYLSYQTHSAQSYTRIKDDIHKYGMKIVKNLVAENVVTTTYAGTNYVISVSISTRAGSVATIYLFTIYPKFLYEIGVTTETTDFYSKNEQVDKSSLPEDFKLISKAFSYAQIYSDIGLTKAIYMVPPDDSVYIIRELNGSNEKIVYVYCNGNYGYMQKSMLREW